MANNIFKSASSSFLNSLAPGSTLLGAFGKKKSKPAQASAQIQDTQSVSSSPFIGPSIGNKPTPQPRMSTSSSFPKSFPKPQAPKPRFTAKGVLESLGRNNPDRLQQLKGIFEDRLAKQQQETTAPAEPELTEEQQLQKDIDDLRGQSQIEIAQRAGQGRGITLPFVTGQQAAIENVTSARLQPLETRLARIQAERQQTEAKEAKETGELRNLAFKALGQGASQSEVDAILNAGSFDGALRASAPIFKRAFDIANRPRGGGGGGGIGASINELSAGEQAALTKANLVTATVDEALGQLKGATTGIFGATAGNIPGTRAFNLKRTLDTLEANIGFAELQAMRNASPTGGALGQVSERELDLLASVLGSLKTTQSKDQLRSNLESIKKHYNNWKLTLQGQIPPGYQQSGSQPSLNATTEELEFLNSI